MTTFTDCFGDVEDPEIDRCKKHKLLSIIGVCLVGVICGCDFWVETEDYAKPKRDFLANLFDLRAGIPSHDTIGRVVAGIDAEQFNQG